VQIIVNNTGYLEIAYFNIYIHISDTKLLKNKFKITKEIYAHLAYANYVIQPTATYMPILVRK